MKLIVGIIIIVLLTWGMFKILHFVVRLRFPPRIPNDLSYEHAFRSERGTRDIAERLAKKFPSPKGDVVCLGVARGNAARILFHSGKVNRGKNANLYRPDYVLEVVRNGHARMLRLTLNRPYSYLRIRRDDVRALVAALHEVYDAIQIVA